MYCRKGKPLKCTIGFVWGISGRSLRMKKKVSPLQFCKIHPIQTDRNYTWWERKSILAISVFSLEIVFPFNAVRESTLYNFSVSWSTSTIKTFPLYEMRKASSFLMWLTFIKYITSNLVSPKSEYPTRVFWLRMQDEYGALKWLCDQFVRLIERIFTL